MRMSALVGERYKEKPADCTIESHALMVRGGYIRQVNTGAYSLLSGVVLSGVPGGGLVGEMLIVSLYGFPPEAFPIIATIGFLVDPAATMVNATGDTCSALIISRLVEGKDWFAKAMAAKAA